MPSVVGGLLELVERTVEGLGYELVDLERAGGGLLRVTLDLPPQADSTQPAAPRQEPAITVDDCERVSHQLTHLFTVESVDYERLEVGSPGVDRPLRKARDFVRFTGEEVNVQLHAPLQGRKRWRGILLGIEGDLGAEKVKLAPLVNEDASAVRRVAAPIKGKGAARQRAAEAARQTLPPIEFALADVDKARLVPVLDFRSKR